MAIGKEEVYEVLGQLHAEGCDVTTDDLQLALKTSKYKSGGNRNEVNGWFNDWCVENGIERKKRCKGSVHTTSKAPSPANTRKLNKSVAESNDSIINMLPESLRPPIITLIKAFCALIGMVHAQERDAATILVDHAKNELQAELDKERQHVAVLAEEIRLLTEENATLKASLLAKHEAVSAETLVAGLAKLAKNESLTSFIAAICQQKEATQEVPATDAVKKQKKPPIKKAA